MLTLNLSIDVIIPTYQRWELTKRCLTHLRAQSAPHSVIVVDNASTDGTRQTIRTSFPEVQLVEMEGNLGFPVACNRGAAVGSGDIVVLLNNDVEPRPDFLELLTRPFRDRRVGSAAALLLRPGEQTIDCMGLTADRTLAGFPRLRGRPTSEAPSSSPVLVGPSGGGGAYRRTAWEKVGGLDEGVMFYGEDVDLALRLQAAGWKTAAVPEAVAVHLGSASAGNRSAWQRYQGGYARGYFLRRYRLLRSSAAARVLATEGIVIVGDALLSRDVSALRGRLAGWRAAKDASPSPRPPEEAIDETISLLDSLRLRRVVYAS
ncbi:MAG: glycosyltransferase family 2 protein [Actinomycetota bacterium]|nr:glycosyltransferase family 2 protein [Actinomycetota bacterium]